MTDPADATASPRNWQSVRTIMEGLILAGILWLGNSTSDQAKATIAVQTQMASMSSEIRDLRGKLDAVTAMNSDIAMLKVQIAEHDRRIGRLEDARHSDAKP